MELPVANLEINTTTLIWIGMVDCIFVSCFYKKHARMEHKYSNVEMSIRMRPLNPLALNDSSKFWSKKLGYHNPLSWAHSHRGRLPCTRLNTCTASVMQQSCCQCHTEITPWSLDKLSNVQNNESWKISRIMSFWTLMSILTGCVVSR